MAGNRYSDEVRKEAVRLHKLGKPYSEISEILGVSSKGTLSYWLSSIVGYKKDSKKQRDHLARVRPLAFAALKRRTEAQTRDCSDKVKKTIQSSSKHLSDLFYLKSLLSMLYWAEGAKGTGGGGIKFANTDPVMHRLFITLLRKVYAVDNAHFSIHLHLHYYHRITEAKKFWSEVLDVPLKRFKKPYFKKRSVTKRYRKNFKGICYVYYGDSNIRRELLELGSQLGHVLTSSREPNFMVK